MISTSTEAPIAYAGPPKFTTRLLSVRPESSACVFSRGLRRATRCREPTTSYFMRLVVDLRWSACKRSSSFAAVVASGKVAAGVPKAAGCTKAEARIETDLVDELHSRFVVARGLTGESDDEIRRMLMSGRAARSRFTIDCIERGVAALHSHEHASRSDWDGR